MATAGAMGRPSSCLRFATPPYRPDRMTDSAHRVRGGVLYPGVGDSTEEEVRGSALTSHELRRWRANAPRTGSPPCVAGLGLGTGAPGAPNGARPPPPPGSHRIHVWHCSRCP